MSALNQNRVEVQLHPNFGVNARARHIAVIDDNPLITDMVLTLLTSLCEVNNVRVFHSGEEFLTHISGGEDPFSVILLDLFMPGMTGYDVCSAIRLQDAEVPIIAFSAFPEERQKALNEGFTDFVAKPIIDVQSFCALVRRYLEQRLAS